jgi:hypothetical protein
MKLSPQVTILGQYLAGEFDNRQQALDQPAWYVHLHLWKRPVPLFTEDSITLYAEQANIVNLDSPYRPRLLRLRELDGQLRVDYYKFHNIIWIKGTGRKPELLKQITPDTVKFLPGCSLRVQTETRSNNTYHFKALGDPASPCQFTYQGQTITISLGFEVNANELKVYDQGIDPQTGKATWGALMGAFCFHKRQDFARELFELD